MKKAILAIVLGGVALGAMAQETPWQVRARAVHLNPADKSDPILGVGPSDLITVSSKTIPEVDVSYFFTPNISAELVLTYPQKHTVYIDGESVGTFKHLPPTLLAQYHFTPSSQVSPYVGVGVNWTTFSKNKILDGAGSLEHDSFGLALQAGLDYKLDKNWSLNVDIKKVQIRSDVLLAGTKVSKVKVDPVLFGVGVGYRF
jgi:outer membrane protein